MSKITFFDPLKEQNVWLDSGLSLPPAGGRGVLTCSTPQGYFTDQYKVGVAPLSKLSKICSLRWLTQLFSLSRACSPHMRCARVAGTNAQFAVIGLSLD